MFILPRIALVIGLIGAGVVLAQEPKRCPVKEESGHVKYRMGLTERGGGDLPLIIQISVDPRNINGTDLVILAKQLNEVFCKEQKINVVIFDSYRYAANFSPSSENPYYVKGLESMRGGYYLDRKTGEEFVQFTTVPNYFKNYENRKRIDINKPSSAKG
jgi:hypothetical protein